MASLTPSQQEEQSPPLQALAVVLQHPAVAADQRNICTLLQVSKTWRIAVQQSVACMLECSFQSWISLDKLGQVISFAGWLAKHAGLVCSLKICPQETCIESDTSQLWAAMNQLVEIALQAAACGSGAPLRMQSYSTHVPATAGLVAALPAASLKQLDLMPNNDKCFTPLNKLTNLRQLRLDMYDVQRGTTNSCLQEIGKLQQLTSLQLEGLSIQSDMQLLPVQLQRLELDYRQRAHASSTNGAQVNLQHLTSLQHLRLRAQTLIAGSSMPANLQSLQSHAEWPAEGVAAFSILQQVTAIELTSYSISKEHLEALQHLGQLRNLSLNLYLHHNPLEVAAVWHRLPLCALSIANLAMPATVLQQLMRHVATATRLTKLQVNIDQIEEDGNEGHELAFFEQLKALKQLSSLCMNIGDPSDFAKHDTEHLSALVALTNLELSSCDCGPFADGATLCMLAVTLTRLRALTINRNGGKYHTDGHAEHITSALPAVGKLSALETLKLRGLPGDEAQRGLRFLTGLNRLTVLQGFDNAGEAALQEFWAAVRRQQQGHLQ